MMQLTNIEAGIFTATNTCKPVTFRQTEFGTWIIETPEGRLLDDVLAEGPFADLASAIRHAETKVSMKMFLTGSEG
jgi:hypothetical protein